MLQIPDSVKLLKREMFFYRCSHVFEISIFQALQSSFGILQVNINQLVFSSLKTQLICLNCFSLIEDFQLLKNSRLILAELAHSILWGRGGILVHSNELYLCAFPNA